MPKHKRLPGASLAAAVLASSAVAAAWTPLSPHDDPLVRMPGTQPADGVVLDATGGCVGCHGGYDPQVEPALHWQGSMMAQAARDPFLWASMAVSAQDSIWALGRPNAADLCLRCHTPPGWLAGRSDPANGAHLAGADFDGITCTFCHSSYDPFFEDTWAGTREGSDYLGYWDESGASNTPSAVFAAATRTADREEAAALRLFNGTPMYNEQGRPAQQGWTEQGGGQYLVANQKQRRGPFADAESPHDKLYSRNHKSRYFCATCHDVSNSALANLAFKDAKPGSGAAMPTEQQPAHAYAHIERTFSEFMLSDFGSGPGAAGIGPFAPGAFSTARPGNVIAACQDCHMARRQGAGASGAMQRPADSLEHPKSGVPLHDMMGGNALVPWLLASTVATSPNYDPANQALLDQPAQLTVRLTTGQALKPEALLLASARARRNLRDAASIEALTYDSATGALSFRVQNRTGHKLASGFPEGRRVFVNVRVYNAGQLVQELNPYALDVGTLKGLPAKYAPSSPPLAAGERYHDELVYEALTSSSLTGEEETFHMVLGTGMFKDNRIPPRGFRIGDAAQRHVEPVYHGAPNPGLYTTAEYQGGHHDVQLSVPPGATGVVVRLYYQTTSREYVEFLEKELKGTATTLASPTPSGEAQAYVAQTDPFFAGLRSWGQVIRSLWDHNRGVPGIAPVLMAQAHTGTVSDPCAAPGAEGAACDDGNGCTTADTCVGGTCQGGPPVICPAPASCKLAGSCVPSTGQCTGGDAPAGTLCAGGTCSAGACVASDAGPGDAAAGTDAAKEELGDSGDSEDGCSCRAGARQPAGGAAALVLAALALGARRKRKPRAAAQCFDG